MEHPSFLSVAPFNIGDIVRDRSVHLPNELRQAPATCLLSFVLREAHPARIFAMSQCMFSVARAKPKIFYPVIGFDFIDMVDNFTALKMATKMFLHYQSVLKHIIVVIAERMIGRKHQNVPVVFNPASFPVAVFVASRRKTDFSLMLFLMFFAESKFP